MNMENKSDKSEQLKKIASDLSEQCVKQLWNTAAFHMNKILPITQHEKTATLLTLITEIHSEICLLIMKDNPLLSVDDMRSALFFGLNFTIDKLEKAQRNN
jgi:hypothetical protein